MSRFAYAHKPKPRRPLGVGCTIHVCATKEWWLEQLRKYGVGILKTSRPLSLDDAIEWVRGYPTTEKIPLDPECDDFDETGGCNGHQTTRNEFGCSVDEVAELGERGSQAGD